MPVEYRETITYYCYKLPNGNVPIQIKLSKPGDTLFDTKTNFGFWTGQIDNLST